MLLSSKRADSNNSLVKTKRNRTTDTANSIATKRNRSNNSCSNANNSNNISNISNNDAEDEQDDDKNNNNNSSSSNTVNISSNNNNLIISKNSTLSSVVTSESTPIRKEPETSTADAKRNNAKNSNASKTFSTTPTSSPHIQNNSNNNSSNNNNNNTNTNNNNINAITNNGNTTNIRSQTKITGFFKTQVKALPSVKKDLTSMVVRSTDFPATNASLNSAVASAQQKDGLKTLCSTSMKHSSHPAINDKQTDIAPKNNCNLSVRALTSITTAPVKKVERKTAKVAPLAPISRKSNAPTKKSYAHVLPKKHVNIAPRTVVDAMKPHQTPANIQMLAKRSDLMQQKPLLQKLTQPTVLLTTIRIPSGQHIALQQSQAPNIAAASIQQQQQQQQPQQQTQTSTQSHQSVQPKNMMSQSTQKQSVNKMNGQIFQLHSAPVMPKLVQIPMAKEATASTASNLVVNNGAHYFFNGAVIKLQQMTTQQVNCCTFCRSLGFFY